MCPVVIVVSMGYKEEGNAGCLLLSRLDCSTSGTVLSVSDYYPAAVSFAAVAVVVAVAWLLSLPLT